MLAHSGKVSYCVALAKRMITCFSWDWWGQNLAMDACINTIILEYCLHSNLNLKWRWPTIIVLT